MISLKWKPYLELRGQWPQSGEHILATFDDKSIIVYQAYRPDIAEFAVRNQKFGGPFSFNRMSWIKPNFLWMMYRSGWATKPGQERILSICIRREFFGELMELAVPSRYKASNFTSESDWRVAVATSEVRLQWDPDHDPSGQPLERRAIQLGLRGTALFRFASEEVISILDITEMVADQRMKVATDLSGLLVPDERVYRSC